MVIERTIQWIAAEGTLRAVAIVLLVFLGLFGLTWRQLVQNLYIGLTGREWVVKSSILFVLSSLVVFGPIVGWILALYAMALAPNALPWIAAALIGLKLSAATAIATAALSQGEVELTISRFLTVGRESWRE